MKWLIFVIAILLSSHTANAFELKELTIVELEKVDIPFYRDLRVAIRYPKDWVLDKDKFKIGNNLNQLVSITGAMNIEKDVWAQCDLTVSDKDKKYNKAYLQNLKEFNQSMVGSNISMDESTFQIIKIIPIDDYSYRAVGVEKKRDGGRVLKITYNFVDSNRIGQYGCFITNYHKIDMRKTLPELMILSKGVQLL